MSEIKRLKENFRAQFMQISNKIWKLKDIYEKVLKEVTCNLWQVLNKSFKSIKKENPHQWKTCIMQKPANQPTMQINWLLQQNASPIS